MLLPTVAVLFKLSVFRLVNFHSVSGKTSRVIHDSKGQRFSLQELLLIIHLATPREANLWCIKQEKHGTPSSFALASEKSLSSTVLAWLRVIAEACAHFPSSEAVIFTRTTNHWERTLSVELRSQILGNKPDWSTEQQSKDHFTCFSPSWLERPCIFLAPPSSLHPSLSSTSTRKLSGPLHGRSRIENTNLPQEFSGFLIQIYVEIDVWKNWRTSLKTHKGY